MAFASCRRAIPVSQALAVIFQLLCLAQVVRAGHEVAGPERQPGASPRSLSTETYADGPAVSNEIADVHCQPAAPVSLETAKTMCDEDPQCQALHSYDCHDWAWRMCTVSAEQLQEESSGTLAGCTKVHPRALPSLPTYYLEGPRVDNGVVITYCNSEIISMTEAVEACDARSDCGALVSYKCLDWAWTYCTSSISVLQAFGSGSESCSKVRGSTSTLTATTSTSSLVTETATTSTTAITGTTTTTSFTTRTDTTVSSTAVTSTAVTSTLVTETDMSRTSATVTATSLTRTTFTTMVMREYLEGPTVSNGMAAALCFSEATTLEAAAAVCDATPACSVLHATNCHSMYWRPCYVDPFALQVWSPGTACTKVDSRYSTMTVSSTTSTVTVTRYVDWMEGPRVDNIASVAWCSPGVTSLEVAQANCKQDPGCTVLHSYKCLDWAWRHCTATIENLQAAGPGTDACTLMEARETDTVTSTTRTTITTTTLGYYIDAPPVSDQAYVGRCSSETTSLEEARRRCDQDPQCVAVHSYECLDWAWRYCGGTVQALLSVGPGSSCLKVKSSHAHAITSVTATSVTATTTTATHTDVFVDGPMVDASAGDHGRCSLEVSTYEGAVSRCNSDPSCTGILHSYKCFAWAWRYCTTNFADLKMAGPGEDSCTKVWPSWVTETSTSKTSSSMTTTSVTSVSTTTTTLRYVEGPRLGNQAWRGHCSEDVFTLDEAMQRCSALAGGCLVLHSFFCEDWAWRYCTSSMYSIEASSTDSLACSKVEVRLVTDTATSSSTTETTESVTTTSPTTTGTTTATSSSTSSQTSATSSTTSTSATSTTTSATTVTSATVTSATSTRTSESLTWTMTETTTTQTTGSGTSSTSVTSQSSTETSSLTSITTATSVSVSTTRTTSTATETTTTSSTTISATETSSTSRSTTSQSTDSQTSSNSGTSSTSGSATSSSTRSTLTSSSTKTTSMTTSTTASTSLSSSTSGTDITTTISTSQTTVTSFTISAAALSVEGSMSLSVPNATALLEDEVAKGAIKNSVAATAGVHPKQVVGLEFSVQRRLQQAEALSGPRGRKPRALSGGQLLTVDYAIAVDAAQAIQVAQTLQEASPDTVATTLQQSFQEAGVGDEYGELGVVGLAVTSVPAVVGTTQAAGAGESRESREDQVVSAAVAAVLASLAALLCCGCFCVCCVCRGVLADEAAVKSGKPVEEGPPAPTAKDLEESQQGASEVDPSSKTTFEVDVDRFPVPDKAESVAEDGATPPVDLAGARESLQGIMDDADPPLDSAASVASRARRWLMADLDQRPQSSGARASAIDSPPTSSWLDNGTPGPRADCVALTVKPGDQAPSSTQPCSLSRGSQPSVKDWLTGGQSTGSTYGLNGQAVVEDVIRAPRISMSRVSWTPASQDAQEQLQSRVAVSLQVRCETPREASTWAETNENLWL